MPGKSTLTADAAEQAALRALSKSEQRGEADRARAILLTLEGRKAEEIAAVLGVHISTVRNWRGYFAHGGVAGLRRRQRPGQQAKIGPHAGAPVCRDCPARWASDLAAVALAPIAPKGFAWRRPRHTLKGRQDAAAVEASCQHLADLKTQAAAGAIDLVFLDESEALTHPYLARCWARRGTELRIQAPGQAKKRAMLGAFDPLRRRLLVHTSATKRSTDFVALLDQLGAAYGTAERARPLVAVLDNGPIHCSKLTTRALAERPWLTLEWLPKYAPELNDIERCWRDLKQHYLANRTFADPDALERAIPDVVARLNHERQLKSSPILIQSA
jgi:transposase